MTMNGLPGFSANDRALVAEAVRRVHSTRGRSASDPDAVAKAISTAFAAGRRDLFGLVKAGCGAA